MTAARLADGVRLRRWPGPVPDEPAGLCLVVPGRGYPATWAGRHEVAGVWLTPLLDDVRVRRAIETYPAPGLVVGGTDDPHWDGGPALTPVAADVQVWDVPGADHSLQVPSWRASVRTQCEVTDRVLALARGLPAGRALSGPGAQVS